MIAEIETKITMAKTNNEPLQSLLDRLKPEDVDAMEQRGHDPEFIRQVMYVKFITSTFPASSIFCNKNFRK